MGRAYKRGGGGGGGGEGGLIKRILRYALLTKFRASKIGPSCPRFGSSCHLADSAI